MNVFEINARRFLSPIGRSRTLNPTQVISMNRLFLSIAFACAVSAAHGATFTVNTFDADLEDSNTALAGCDGNPVVAGDQCTLRAAIMQANASAAADTIVIPIGAQINLTANGIGPLGDLDITQPVTITGILFGMPNDATQLPEIRGVGLNDRLFDVSAPDVVFRGLVLRDGDAGGSFGGAIRNNPSGNVSVDRVRFTSNEGLSGGAIANSGIMSITASSFDLNRGEDASAIYNAGMLTLTGSSIRSTLDVPSATPPEAINSISGSRLSVLNSTISGTTGTDSGGITATTPEVLLIRNSTFNDFSHRALSVTTNNTSSVSVVNSIFFGSDDQDCNIAAAPGAFVDVSYNLLGSGNCAAQTGNLGSNLAGLDPLLSTLQNDLGQGRLSYYYTMPFASPAVDRGAPDSTPPGTLACLSDDQRGTGRPLDGDAVNGPRCDMGAIEVSQVGSATYVVNVRNQDLPDANPLDGICDGDALTPGLQCTLRAAVMQANQKLGPDRIEFAAVVGSPDIRLTIPPAAEPNAAVGDLNISEELTIAAELFADRPRIRILQDTAARVFSVGLPPGQSARFEGLRIWGGDTIAQGGGIAAFSGARLWVQDSEFFDNKADLAGGAIYSAIQLVVRDSDFSSNDSLQLGAAIRAEGEAAVYSSSFRFNIALDADTSLRAAISAALGTPLVQLINSTLSDNSGGLWSRATTTQVIQSTIINNLQYGLRVVDLGGIQLILRATVLADNNAGDCSLLNGPITNLNNHNFIGDGSCPGGATNLSGNPNLAPNPLRADNQRTYVYMPLHTSPLIDYVPSGASCLTTDQRGQPRPIDSVPGGVNHCEIGAVELAPFEADERLYSVNVFDSDPEFGADLVDVAPGDSACDASTKPGIQCTLRAAIMEANALPGADEIRVNSTDQVITLDKPALAGPASAAHGDLDITDTLTISRASLNPAGRALIQGGHNDRLFTINAPGDTVAISGLRLRAGFTAGSGGAVRVTNANTVTLTALEMFDNVADAGGAALAVFNGIVILRDSDLYDNVTVGLGAAILNESTLTIIESSIRNNTDLSGGTAREAIHGAAASTTQVLNSTISGNNGDGIETLNATLVVRNATITQNARRAIDHTGVAAVSLTIANSILVGNSLNSCSSAGVGTLATGFFNMADAGSGCDLTAAGNNVIGTASLLGPLQLQPSRLTASHRPAPTSAAVDGGNPFNVGIAACLPVDQHGTARPIDGDNSGSPRCDIGAIEGNYSDVIFADSFED